MEKKDYYMILGVARDASPDEIKKAYRQAALRYHPDRNPGDKAAEERFKDAAQAYSVLADPDKRSLYDRFGAEGLRGADAGGFPGFDSTIFSDFEDILGNFFGFSFGDLFGGGAGRRRPAAQRGRDLAVEIALSLEEVAHGTEKQIQVARAEICPACRGGKAAPGTRPSRCPQCQGRGQVRSQQGFFVLSRTCPRCAGRGEVIASPCPDCRGTGTQRQKRTLTIRIPAGVDDGTRLRLQGEGEAGDREDLQGDLYVITRVRTHPFFERTEQNLTCRIEIAFSQAALGIEVEIPTLEGNEILKIPAGTQPGEVIRLKGKGLRDLDGRRKGDLFVKVDVRVPDRLTKEQKALLRQLAETRGETLDGLETGPAQKARNAFH
ncbi:MAG: molecular chaperone DnaJ [Candidatus Aminicenantes bacterium]|nr:molecular chaperone DnaJ [Candidatus Aminicenantes bacterium]